MTKLSFDVVIPTLNEDENIGNLLDSILSQSFKPKHVFVIDAGSHDNTQKIVKLKQTKNVNVQLHVAKPPVGNQRQVGANMCKSNYIVFLDADSHIKRDFFEKTFKKIKRRNLEVAVPFYLPHNSTIAINMFFLFLSSMFVLTQWFLPGGAGACIFIKRKLFNDIGGVKLHTTYEDIELVRRAGKKGKFGAINVPFYTSDRRFKTYGTARTMLKYLVLSVFFVSGTFKLANIIKYEFDGYKPKKANN